MTDAIEKASDETRPFDKYSEGESLNGDVLISGFVAAHDVQTIRQALRKYQSKQPSEGVWQDISTAPRDGTEILVFTGGYHIVHFNEETKTWVDNRLHSWHDQWIFAWQVLHSPQQALQGAGHV